jgi:hypothetical protein
MTERRSALTTIAHQPSDAPTERRWSGRVTRDVSVSLAIAVIWIVVLLDALFGPDIVASNAGTSFTRIPSAIVVAFFAYLATHVVAKCGFSRAQEDAAS